MGNDFEQNLYKEFAGKLSSGENVIKASQLELNGKTKIDVEQDSHGGVKIILKKDEHDAIKEIKFVCSCGETKSIVLDYTE
ncbi:MAG: hypothetical protein IPM56_14635 [Ignavibacteriales bacterium]|nr:MAG: hypothetical protein IPM56_14635 [Ignavibacteriales bacterium]